VTSFPQHHHDNSSVLGFLSSTAESQSHTSKSCKTLSRTRVERATPIPGFLADLYRACIEERTCIGRQWRFHSKKKFANKTGPMSLPTGVLLRVEFLLKTDSGYPKDTGVNKRWQPLGIPSAITPIGQLHQSPPSPIPGDRRCPSHQSHVLEHRDTYGQAQVCSKGHQGSSVDRPCQPSFHWIKFCHVRNPLPQSIRLHLIFLVRYWAGQGE